MLRATRHAAIVCAMKTAFVTLLASISFLSGSILPACGTGGAVRAGGASPTASATGRGRSCGGDVVGSWTIVSSNISLDVAKMATDCPSATGAGKSITMAGEARYGADGTYTQVSSFTGSLTINLPAPCIGPGLTCADLARAFIGEMFLSAQCAAGGDGCSCTVALAPTKHTVSGKYTKPSVGLLSETDTGESTADLTDYCVEGATMTQSPHPGGGSGMSGSIVLKKQ